MQGHLVCLLSPTSACPSTSGYLQWQAFWFLYPPVCKLVLEKSSKRSLHYNNACLTTMRCPFLALYTVGSCPVLKSTALSLPAWISILMLIIITKTHSIWVWGTCQINFFSSVINVDPPALNHFHIILFLCSDNQFGQKLIKMVALHYEVPLKQAQNNKSRWDRCSDRRKAFKKNKIMFKDSTI